MAVSKGIIEIKKERCKGCLLCVGACPKKSLAVSGEPNKSGFYPVEFNGKNCTGCGLCYTVCPEPGCITVFLRPGRDK